MKGSALLGQPKARMLLVGYPGGGKTGAITGLLNAGYKVRYLDFEGNYEPLLAYTDRKMIDNLDIVTLQDKYRNGIKSMEVLGKSEVFNGAMKLLQRWKYTDPQTGEEVDLGASKEWGSDTVIAVDSMSSLGEACLIRAMQALNKTPHTMSINVYGAAVSDEVGFFKALLNKSYDYHVVVLGHLIMLGPDDFIKMGDADEVEDAKLDAVADRLIPTKLFPKAATKNLSQLIHKEFPEMVLAEKDPNRPERRRLVIGGRKELDLKFPAKTTSMTFPLEDGLPTLFEALGIKAPKG